MLFGKSLTAPQTSKATFTTGTFKARAFREATPTNCGDGQANSWFLLVRKASLIWTSASNRLAKSSCTGHSALRARMRMGAPSCGASLPAMLTAGPLANTLKYLSPVLHQSHDRTRHSSHTKSSRKAASKLEVAARRCQN